MIKLIITFAVILGLSAIVGFTAKIIDEQYEIKYSSIKGQILDKIMMISAFVFIISFLSLIMSIVLFVVNK